MILATGFLALALVFQNCGKMGAGSLQHLSQSASVSPGNAGGIGTASQMVLVQSNPAALVGKIQIGGVGSKAFDPTKMAVWNYDENNPVVRATDHGAGSLFNIYAPNIVYQGNHLWNIYFGGEDGTSGGYYDRISMLTSSDDFAQGSFSDHVLQIDNGAWVDVNNESVIKLDSTHWEMVYTTLDGSTGLNKPGFAFSSDGAHWTPSIGDRTYMLQMTGAPDWAAADVNGTNVLYFENGTYYLYWKKQTNSVQYSTSSDGVNFSYGGQLITEDQAAAQFPSDCPGINDAKKINGQYLWLFHCNTNKVWFSTGRGPLAISPAQILFRATADVPRSSGPATARIWANPEPSLTTFANPALDPYIVSAGIVTDGTRLYGLLYGATADPNIDAQSLFARWLQRKVIFRNAEVRWGDNEVAFGPDSLRIYLDGGVTSATGNFDVYDSDGTTLLYTSPVVTIHSGDVWSYIGA